ncbi:MAG: GNAT family N-acetyltransferase [Clostridiales bacterium]|nr:GNAT family N-acetyltransferase [Clostridiales bacterium]
MMTYTEMFQTLQPGFFEKPYIRSLPEAHIFDEQIIDLHEWQAGAPVPCPAHITFGFYKGDVETLRAAVREVDEDWPQWFGKVDRVFCAFDGEKVASFCILDAFGEADGLKVGAPGCVGTVPAYRRQGIGLRMVQLATAILKDEGYDLSWIHYTHVGHWYARLGYKTVVRWNCKGVVE